MVPVVAKRLGELSAQGTPSNNEWRMVEGGGRTASLDSLF